MTEKIAKSWKFWTHA